MSLARVDGASAGSPAGSRQGLYPTFSAQLGQPPLACGGFVLAEERPKLSEWLRAVTNTLFRKDPRDISLVDRAGSSWITTWFKRLLWRVECIISGSRSIN